MDFGVYDYRQPNASSKNTAYIQAHNQFSATDFYAICWFDSLPAADAAIVKALPSGSGESGKKSDYCK